jgi:hypothetical protein
MQNVAICRLQTEFLVLQVGQRSAHQNGAGEQHQRQRSLKHDQAFLRQGRSIASGPIGSAQRFSRLSVRRDPCGAGTEQNASEQRYKEREAQHQERRAGVHRNALGVRKCEGKNEMSAKVGHQKTGEAADTTEYNTFGQNLTRYAAPTRS